MAGFQSSIGEYVSTGSLPSGTRWSIGCRRSEKAGSKQGPDLKLQRIINKFKAGKKLSSGELAYLADKNPPLHQKVVRIMQEREMLEAKLEQAKTKEEAAKILAQEMNSIDKLSNNDEFETTARVNQYNDAYTEFVKSDGYQDMPDTDIELAEEKSRRRKELTGEAQAEENRRKRRKRRRKKAARQDDVLNRLRYARPGPGMEQLMDKRMEAMHGSGRLTQEDAAGYGELDGEETEGCGGPEAEPHGFDMLAGDTCYGGEGPAKMSGNYDRTGAAHGGPADSGKKGSGTGTRPYLTGGGKKIDVGV